ncbi:unnamed protein product, partial [Ectocarpus fasciculatus]
RRLKSPVPWESSDVLSVGQVEARQGSTRNSGPRPATFLLKHNKSLFVATFSRQDAKDKSNDGETVSPGEEVDPEAHDIASGDTVVDETAVAWTPDGKRKVLSTAASFKAICAENGYSFDTLANAKHATMMIVYHISHPDAPWVLPMCGACGEKTGHRFNAVGSSGTVEVLSSGGNLY